MDRKQPNADPQGQSRDNVAQVIDEMPVGVVFYGADGQVIRGNHLWQEYHHYSDREAEHGTHFETHGKLDSERGKMVYDAKGQISDALSADFEPSAMEGRFTAQLDESRWLDIRNRRTSGGGVVSVQADITEQVERQERLSCEQSILQAAIAAMPSGISIKDPNGRYMAFNEKISDLFDLPKDMIHTGSSFEDVARYQAARGDHGDGDVDKLVNQEVDILKTLNVKVYEKTLATGRTLELRRSKLPDGGVVTIAADVSERIAQHEALQKAKEDAELASRAKTEFLANMSHEFRTPLNAMIGFSEVLSGQMYGPLGCDKYVEYAGHINDAGHHLLGVINDVLDVSKIEAGEFLIHEEEISVAETIAECIEMMADCAERAKVHLHQDVPAGFPPLRADPLRLKQILLNLLSNAIKFTPSEGRVRLSVNRREDGAPVIEVADSGIGIAQEDIPHVLEPFGQVDGIMTRNQEGTGLGLSLSRAFAELHGGRLEIDSVLGQGTKIRIRLPAERVVGG